MTKKKQGIIYSLLFIVLVVLDQLSKWGATLSLENGSDKVLIPNILRLHYLENKGAAWGMLQGHTWLFTLITVIVFALLIFFFLKLPTKRRFVPLCISLTILASGAIGNFIDRIMNQYVIDFIYFEIIDFPIFNVADIYVSVSAFLLLFLLLFFYNEEELNWKKK